MMLLGPSLSIAPGGSGLICVFFPLSLEIYDWLETKNWPGRGWFGALHRSFARLSMIRWEKLMVALARMVMNFTVTWSFEFICTRSKEIDGLKKNIFHKNRFNRITPFHHAQRTIVMSQRKIIVPKKNCHFPIDFPLKRIVSLSDFYESCNDPFTWRLQK